MKSMQKLHGIGTVVVLTLAGLMILNSCGSAGAGGSGGGGDSITIAAYPSIPGSVLGRTNEVDIVAAMSSQIQAAAAEAYLGQAELLAEYGEFMAIPETGMNYNEAMAGAFPIFQQWAQDYQDGVGDWRPADPPYDTELDFAFDPQTGIFRATEDFTHYEAIISDSGDGTRIHYEVRKHANYTHGFMYAYLTSGNAAVDTVDIVSTDDWTFTKVVRIFNLNGTMDVNNDENPDDYADIDIVAAINRNDTYERVLGVKRHGEYTLPGDLSTATYVPGTWDDRVGAFDSTQLAIRPDTRPTSPALWQDSYPDGGYPAQGETFDSSLFPSQANVEKLFDVGINPAEVGQWVINTDLSRNYNFPEWDPAGISFDGIVP